MFLWKGPTLHDCSYYNTAPDCSNSNFHCFKNGQLYGKALDTVFVSMYAIGGVSSSVYTCQKLSTEFTNDIEQVTQSIEALQD
jgi:hypothetical protein